MSSTVCDLGGAAGPAIELEDLTKVFPGRVAADGTPLASVADISLRIEPGEIYALLGPNGAGKSTTVRMIATLLTPTSGRVRVCGLDARTHDRRIRALLGVALGGERSVYWKLTARQNLEYFAALHGLSRRRCRARIAEILERLELADRADSAVETWSTGMRQRLVLARALLNRPAVLLLDEPSSGLDPRAAQTIHEHVEQLRQAGHTILLTTHDMDEADSLSDRLGIIDGGRLVAEGTAADLKRSVGTTRVVRTQLAHAAGEDLAAVLAELEAVGGATVQPDGDGVSTLTLPGRPADRLLPALTAAAARHGVTVLRVENEHVSLRDVFLARTGRRLSGDDRRPEPDPG